MVPRRNGSSETSNRYGGKAPAFSSKFHDDNDDEFVDDEAREKPFESGGGGRAFGTEAPKGIACFSFSPGGGACSYHGGAGLGRERDDDPLPLLVIRVGGLAPVEMMRCVSVEVGPSVVRDATRAFGEGEGELGWGWDARGVDEDNFGFDGPAVDDALVSTVCVAVKIPEITCLGEDEERGALLTGSAAIVLVLLL